MNVFPTDYQHPAYIAECNENLPATSCRGIDCVMMNDAPWDRLIQKGLVDFSHFTLRTSARTLMWNREVECVKAWIEECHKKQFRLPMLEWAEILFVEENAAKAWRAFQFIERVEHNVHYNVVDILILFNRTDAFYRALHLAEEHADAGYKKINLALIHHQLLGNTERAHDLVEESLFVQALTIRDHCACANYLRLTDQHIDFARQLLQDSPLENMKSFDAIRLARSWKQLFMDNIKSKACLDLASKRAKKFYHAYQCAVEWMALHRDGSRALQCQKAAADLATNLQEKKDSASLKADITSALRLRESTAAS